MDNIAASERAKFQNEELPSLSAWETWQSSIAAETDLAILLVEGHQPPQLAISNNNSICHAFQSSTAHAHLCDPYCGEAFKRAHEAGEAAHYRCHAGLHCFAMPLDLNAARPLAVIGGRVFLSSADYRELAERFRTGDLRDLLSSELFRNVLFASHHDLEVLSARLVEAAAKASAHTAATTIDFTDRQQTLSGEGGDGEEARAAAAYFPPGMKLQNACRSALEKLIGEFNLKSVALMMRTDEGLASVSTTGKFKAKTGQLSAKVKNIVNLKFTGGDNTNDAATAQLFALQGEDTEFFSLVVGDELKGALLVGDGKLPEETRRGINEFCREVAMPLEVLRLREELERRLRASYHLKAFTEQMNEVEPAESYATILRHSTELLRSERGSLLMFDEAANELEVKAAVGPRADVTQEQRVRLTESVAGEVLLEGRPRVVRDVAGMGLRRASAERKYKNDSFISYPIITGGRKVGVLNMTDKAGGEAYDEIDLRMLELIAPQMALALDRAEWHQKATQFQLLSITDPLTGLLNRRYLEERLSEELDRSKRHRFAMSFLMIDIDNFKEYNDRHGHQAGDHALEMTAQCLKSALRSADVASRYGGEEFSILLPQTSITEAAVIAERIRSRVEKSPYPHSQSQPHGAVTVSIGISAIAPKLDTPASIVGAADHALYVAKSRGKNCVVSYLSPPTASPTGNGN